MKNKRLWIAVVLALLLSACGGGGESSPLYAQRGSVSRLSLGELYPAADAGTVLAALQGAGQRASGLWEPQDADRTPEGARLLLDEGGGDTVAAHEGCIYILDSYGLILVSAAGTGSELLSETQVERGICWNQRLCFGEDRVAILWTEDSLAPDGSWDGGAWVRAAVLDTADKRHPRLLSEILLEGTLAEACTLDGTLCLVTQKPLLTLPEAKEADALLPVIEENGKALTLRASDVYLSQDPARSALTLVTALRLEDGRVADALAFTDGVEAVCGAGSDLYLCRSYWQERAAAPTTEGPYTVTEYEAAARTELRRLHLEGTLTLADCCALEGSLADPEALALTNGRLGLALETDSRGFAAYTDEVHGWTNYEGRGRETGSRLVLLDGELNVLGSLTDLGGEGGAAACRFLNANAWLTAGDTLGVADLSDPAAAAVCGSFPAQGETLLLRDLGAARVLAASLPDSKGQWQLTMYDLSSPGSPAKLGSVSPEAAPAGDLTAPGALLADGSTGLIGYAAAGKNGAEYRLLRWTGAKFAEEGALDLEYVPANARGLLLEGLLYVCSSGGVYVVDPETLNLLATVANAVG